MKNCLYTVDYETLARGLWDAGSRNCLHVVYCTFVNLCVAVMKYWLDYWNIEINIAYDVRHTYILFVFVFVFVFLFVCAHNMDVYIRTYFYGNRKTSKMLESNTSSLFALCCFAATLVCSGKSCLARARTPMQCTGNTTASYLPSSLG